MHKKTVGQRRAAYMRTVRRKVYDDAKETDAGSVRFYENYLEERRSIPKIVEVDIGSASKIKLPIITLRR